MWSKYTPEVYGEWFFDHPRASNDIEEKKFYVFTPEQFAQEMAEFQQSAEPKINITSEMLKSSLAEGTMKFAIDRSKK